MSVTGSAVSVVIAGIDPAKSASLCSMLGDAGISFAVASPVHLIDLVRTIRPQVVVLHVDAIDADATEVIWSLLALEHANGPVIVLHTDAPELLPVTLAGMRHGDTADSLLKHIDSVLSGRHQQPEPAQVAMPARHAAPKEALSIFDIDGRFIFLSQSCRTLWGWTPEQIASRNFYDLLEIDDAAASAIATADITSSEPPPNRAAEVRAAAAAAQAGGATIYFLLHQKVAHGHTKELCCALDWSPSRQVFYCHARPAATEAIASLPHGVQAQSDLILRGLNRALRMLSACNQVLIRAASEQELLREVSRIVCTIGGYRMSWVGFALDDAYKTISPVARAGDDTFFLDELRISWSADTALGFGPSGITIRNGTPTSINDILASENFAPWVRKFVDAGLRSVVCLPLRDADRTFGSFSLYSAEPRTVPDEEMALLQELADNLAFGIEVRRVEDERRRLRITVEKIAAAVSETTTRSAGEFFRQMAANMVDAVGAQAGFIARFDANDAATAHTIAVVCDGQANDDFSCALHAAPFADLHAHFEIVIKSNAASMLTGLPTLCCRSMQAYVGRRLDNPAGVPVGMLFVLFHGPLDRVDYILSTLRIIGTRVGAEMERQSTDVRLRAQAALLDYATDAIIVRDMDGMVTFWNKGAERLYGWTGSEASGRQMLSRTESESFDLHDILHLTTRNGEWRGELQQRRKDGYVLPVEARWTLIRDEHGAPLSIMSIETDISQRKSAENKIEHLAFYDLLTDLPNRSLLRDRLQHSLDSNDRHGRLGALLGIDLDNFKVLNDSYGHDIGDLLLQLVAVRLSYCLRAGDTVARVGGDEFVILLVDLGESLTEAASRAKLVAEKILLSFKDPFLLGEHEAHSTPSIGITLITDGETSADELLRRADLAMYQSKAAGRNTMQFFDTNMQAVVSARTSLETEMRAGLKTGQFLLYFQVQVDAAGAPTGAEALVRWQHPTRGLVAPQYFIPLAEETGLIIQLGTVVLESACRALASWALDPALADLSLAVNVSARQLRQSSFVKDVLSVLEQTGANPRRLKLELTESLLVESVDDTILKMTELKSRGVGFSLDDFGVGYSSLSYLKLLPLDQLKIDQSFVRDILTDPNDEAISRTIVALGNSLGLSVIAEGVETAEQKSRLAGLGCFFYQGYFFSRPVPIDEFLELVRRGVR